MKSLKQINVKMKFGSFLFVSLSIIFFLFSTHNTYAGGGTAEDAYLAFAEVMPEPADGYNTMFKKIVYPDMARNAGVEGKLYLLVYVNENGGVDDVKVVKSLGAGCDEAAIKAIKDTKFKAGKNAGAAVKVKLSIPVSFKLQ